MHDNVEANDCRKGLMVHTEAASGLEQSTILARVESSSME